MSLHRAPAAHGRRNTQRARRMRRSALPCRSRPGSEKKLRRADRGFVSPRVTVQGFVDRRGRDSRLQEHDVDLRGIGGRLTRGRIGFDDPLQLERRAKGASLNPTYMARSNQAPRSGGPSGAGKQEAVKDRLELRPPEADLLKKPAPVRSRSQMWIAVTRRQGRLIVRFSGKARGAQLLFQSRNVDGQTARSRTDRPWTRGRAD